MEDVPTFPLKFLENMLQYTMDEIKKVENNGEMEYVERRTKIDALIGDFDGLWRHIYDAVQKIYGEEISKAMQKRLLIYHIKHEHGGFDGLPIWANIGFDSWGREDYEKLKEEVLMQEKYVV